MNKDQDIDREYLWPTPFDGERSVEDRVEITGKPERMIEKIEMGMLRNMDIERFYLDRVKVPGKILRCENEKK